MCKGADSSCDDWDLYEFEVTQQGKQLGLKLTWKNDSTRTLEYSFNFREFSMLLHLPSAEAETTCSAFPGASLTVWTHPFVQNAIELGDGSVIVLLDHSNKAWILPDPKFTTMAHQAPDLQSRGNLAYAGEL